MDSFGYDKIDTNALTSDGTSEKPHQEKNHLNGPIKKMFRKKFSTVLTGNYTATIKIQYFGHLSLVQKIQI